MLGHLEGDGGLAMARLVSAVLLVHIPKSKVKTVKERDKTEQSGENNNRSHNPPFSATV